LSTTFTPATITIQTTSVRSDREDGPKTFALEQNYPNPFHRSTGHSRLSPITTIKFSLPRPGHVTLKVYSLLGKEVAVLVDGEMASGRHEANWEAAGLESGVYFYRLQSGTEVLTKKLILMQ
jgi:hypothetical protein